MMGPGKKIFEIPIYFRMLHEHGEDWQAQVDDLLRYIERNSGINLTDEQKKRYTLDFERREWKPWSYNDVMAWIYLVADGATIKAYGYVWKTRRVGKRTVDKTYVYWGKLNEVWLTYESNAGIAREVGEMLNEISRQKKFKGRHMDREAFDAIAPHLDWRGLMDLP